MNRHPLKNCAAAFFGAALLALAACVPAFAASLSAVRPDPTEYAHITDCVLDAEGNVMVAGMLEGVVSDPNFYDSYLYLFELKPYEDSINGRTDYCSRIPKSQSGANPAFHFSVPANLGTPDDRLYSKFVVAVKSGGEYVQSSNAAYVTNPEAVAVNTQAYQSSQTKKGLLIQTTDSCVSDAFELGVSHVIVNIPFERLLGEGIDYVYDGVTYHFSKDLLDTYDNIIRRFSEKGMNVTAVLLNGWNDSTPQLYYPGVTRQANAAYYAFNASTREGCDTIKAVATFLADRYRSLASPYGKVSNWIIGNEVNDRYWNYTADMTADQYIKEYERAFRLFYTAIRSTNKNDRVFFSTNYFWNYPQGNTTQACTARYFIEKFAENVRSGGDVEWGLAYHPYSVPMQEPEFWDDEQTGLVNQTADSPIVNLCNLSVLTDFMQNSSLRSAATGQVRHIILSEQGFTSVSETRGVNEDLQAAAIAYAYYIIDSNPYIDAFIMSRQVDAPSEAAESLYFGLWNCDMNNPYDIVPTTKKKSWQVYKYIDQRTRTLEVSEFAKSIIGISSWSEVIPNFKWKSSEH